MSRYQTAIWLVTVQCLLVLTIAGKYFFERKTCPRVWARAANIDPNSPMRGRYLILPLEVDACDLSPSGDTSWVAPPGMRGVRAGLTRSWNAKVVARDGKLVAVSMANTAPSSIQVKISQQPGEPCSRAEVQENIDYYIPDTAKWPPRLGANDSLWVEVTVPPAGPPRPIQLAVSRSGVFTPLKLN